MWEGQNENGIVAFFFSYHHHQSVEIKEGRRKDTCLVLPNCWWRFEGHRQWLFGFSLWEKCFIVNQESVVLKQIMIWKSLNTPLNILDLSSFTSNFFFTKKLSISLRVCIFLKKYPHLNCQKMSTGCEGQPHAGCNYQRAVINGGLLLALQDHYWLGKWNASVG